MGRRGPRPAPSALKRARGVRPDRINEAEPVPSDGLAPCPDYLSSGAQAVWDRLAPDLSRRGVLTTWDADVFALYCDLVDLAWRAREHLELGLLVKGRRDGVITTPAWRIYRDAIAEIRALAQEFGLTPSARSLIRVRGLPDAIAPSSRKTDP
jgi:P27 family predicted phage terminase small subunit